MQRFPGLGSEQQVSQNTGLDPLWSHAGNELFYLSRSANGVAASLWSVDVAGGTNLTLGRPRLLFEGAMRILNGPGRPAYDVTEDGRRFLIIKPGWVGPAALEFVVVLNWFTELERRVPRRQ